VAIIFHEGLPRSGKSYEAMSRHIAKALREGRPVDAYIEGIDHEKIAAAVELPVDRVRELLRAFTREEVPTMHGQVRANALIVIDEAQNFWPTGRQRLDAATTQFITEHGHRGQDILLMGQVLTDVHKLWRGRVEMKMVFTKLNGVGLETRYNVATWKAPTPEKFVKLGDQVGSYDPRWFGTYSSHVDSSIQTGNYKDDRANILKGWKFKFGIPAVLILGVVSIGYLVWFMSGGAAGQAAKPVAAAAAAWARVARPAARPAAPKAADLPFVVSLNSKFRPRLAGYAQLGAWSEGHVEWYDGDRLVERLSFTDIRRLGTAVSVVAGGSLIAVVGDRYVTHWPAPERAKGGQVPAVPALSLGGAEK
jgi:zona occludens toxin